MFNDFFTFYFSDRLKVEGFPKMVKLMERVSQFSGPLILAPPGARPTRGLRFT